MPSTRVGRNNCRCGHSYSDVSHGPVICTRDWTGRRRGTNPSCACGDPTGPGPGAAHTRARCEIPERGDLDGIITIFNRNEEGASYVSPSPRRTTFSRELLDQVIREAPDQESSVREPSITRPIPPEISDKEACELWRALSELVNEGRKLEFYPETMNVENPASQSGRPRREMTGAIFATLVSLPIERHLFGGSQGHWRSVQANMEACVKDLLLQRENSRAKYKREAAPADNQPDEGEPPADLPPQRPIEVGWRGGRRPSMPEEPESRYSGVRNQIVRLRQQVADGDQPADMRCPVCTHHIRNHAEDGFCAPGCGHGCTPPPSPTWVRMWATNGGRCGNCAHPRDNHVAYNPDGSEYTVNGLTVPTRITCGDLCACHWDRASAENGR